MKRMEYYQITTEQVKRKNYVRLCDSKVIRTEDYENLGEYISRIGCGLYNSDIVDETDEVIVWWITFESLFEFDQPMLREWYVVELKQTE